MDETGICRVCGFQIEAASAPPEPRAEVEGTRLSPSMPELPLEATAESPAADPTAEEGGREQPEAAPGESAEAEPLEEDLPEWRKELSRRLAEIKKKRAAALGRSPADTGAARSAAEAAPAPKRRRTSGAARPKPDGREPPVKPPAPEIPPLLFTAETRPQDSPEPLLKRSAPQDSESNAIRGLIDRAVGESRSARRIMDAPKAAAETTDTKTTGTETRDAKATASEKATGEGSTDRMKTVPVPAELPPPAELAASLRIPEVDKLILLSRTLAGLIDLIAVFACASSFVFAVDILEGIDLFDRVSLYHYGALVLVTFFVYSCFFLATANQTVGMMITDLRLTGEGVRGAPPARILTRCALYLPALLVFGIGLLWGCFDDRSRCLHDRFSRTRVIRLQTF